MIWFLHTLLAIILPFTSSRTSCLVRVFQTLFGSHDIGRKRYYSFMASPKIPWNRLWSRIWKMISKPNGRLIVPLDDYINPKTWKNNLGWAKVFDHAARQKQSQYFWVQNIVVIGLLKVINDRWACLPLCLCYYFLKDGIKNNKLVVNTLAAALMRMAA